MLSSFQKLGRSGRRTSAEHVAATSTARSTRQTALIGAAAVLISGFLSLGSAVVAGQISARSSTVAVVSETERSKAEFLRSQRQAFYAKLAQHEADVNDARNVLLDHAAGGRRLGTNPLQSAENRDYVLAIQVLDTDAMTATLLASNNVLANYDKILEIHHEMQSAISDYLLTLDDVCADDCRRDELQEKIADTEPLLNEQELELFAFARADMGIDVPLGEPSPSATQ